MHEDQALAYRLQNEECECGHLSLSNAYTVLKSSLESIQTALVSLDDLCMSPPDQSHLVTNRERNQLLRQDTPKAREEQIREDHEAAIAQTALELALAQQ